MDRRQIARMSVDVGCPYPRGRRLNGNSGWFRCNTAHAEAIASIIEQPNPIPRISSTTESHR
jgi:hypothetical protein